MNNAKIILKSGISKTTNKDYYYLLITLNEVEVGRLFIKTTEVPYYKELLKYEK